MPTITLEQIQLLKTIANQRGLNGRIGAVYATTAKGARLRTTSGACYALVSAADMKALEDCGLVKFNQVGFGEGDWFVTPAGFEAVTFGFGT